jgi:hypothetical protein
MTLSILCSAYGEAVVICYSQASVPIPKFAKACSTTDANFGIVRTLATL